MGVAIRLLRCAQLLHSQKMRMFKTILLFSLMEILACRPGGYTGTGGMFYSMNQTADYMHMAVKAAKMAISMETETPKSLDESLIAGSAYRGSRQSVYTPTFITSQPAAVAAAV